MIFFFFYTLFQIPKLFFFYFQDVDEDEVENFLSDSCHLTTEVKLKVPFHKILNNKTANYENGKIASVLLLNFNRNQFKYDATWFTKQFHSLNAVWRKQHWIVKNKLSTIVQDSFLDALKKVWYYKLDYKKGNLTSKAD